MICKIVIWLHAANLCDSLFEIGRWIAEKYAGKPQSIIKTFKKNSLALWEPFPLFEENDRRPQKSVCFSQILAIFEKGIERHLRGKRSCKCDTLYTYSITVKSRVLFEVKEPWFSTEHNSVFCTDMDQKQYLDNVWFFAKQSIVGEVLQLGWRCCVKLIFFLCRL